MMATDAVLAEGMVIALEPETGVRACDGSRRPGTGGAEE
jgi:hypothetical protein